MATLDFKLAVPHGRLQPLAILGTLPVTEQIWLGNKKPPTKRVAEFLQFCEDLGEGRFFKK